MNFANAFALSLQRNLALMAIAAAATLAGCSTIPSSGPTGGQIVSQIENELGALPIKLVEVRSVGDLPTAISLGAVFSEDYTPPAPTELVGPGDVLSIAIYETGIGLFGGGAAVGGADQVFDPSSRAERFPAMRVDDDGTINLPFVGDIMVAGRTTNDIERLLRNALRRKSQNPQVLVSIAEGLTNSVIIGGDVRQPGRLVLPTNRESLSDVIALSGGNTGEIKDMLVRVQRGETFSEFRLSDIMANPGQDIRIFPADRIQLVRAPQSFSVLGAAGRNDQIAFPGPRLSLIEAVAVAGGSNPNSGDPRAIFLFRFVEDLDGKDTPTVYHFNMMQASSYLLAQRFAIKDKDVLYIGNAEANQPTKLVQIVSQLFFPLVTLEGVINRPN
ncbi:polysaccharide biosynthesis/export family protein [Erythrobacter sp.]|uniref:polysaccharide biosynthesis/export family protein n=1 Tax=Erythrobacter sp. TaxID=1042 RepID=UPI0025CF689A|nr:polysaccharide biosynthesis/export family protein [Erythrobacter sp.]